MSAGGAEKFLVAQLDQDWLAENKDSLVMCFVIADDFAVASGSADS